MALFQSRRISHALLSLLVLLLAASPTQAFETKKLVDDFKSWLFDFQSIDPSMKEEIKCYDLPYGGIGFASHVITYYTIFIVMFQRSPWMPWKLSTHWRFDLILSIVSLVSTLLLSTLTMIRCRHRWEFICLAVWKFLMSLTLTSISIASAVAIRKGAKDCKYSRLEDEEELKVQSNFQRTKREKRKKKEQLEDAVKNYRRASQWLIALYAPGGLAGLAGLFSVVAETIQYTDHVRTITIAFGATSAVLAFFVAVALAWARISDRKDPRTGAGAGDISKGVALGFFGAVGAGIGLFMILFAFYSDWVLGAIAQNVSGVPSSDTALLYWSYFVAKRLPFLMY